MTYFQVDRGLFSSSTWLTGSPEERCLWLWLLGNRDDQGVVHHRELAIADGAKLPRDVVDAALKKFAAPDPDSRTRENEGRRIARTEDGFIRILNHELYYSKDYSTPRWRRWKDRQRLANAANATNAVGNEGQGKGQGQGHTETDGRPPAGAVPVVGAVNGNGNGPAKGAGSATERERARLEADPVLAGLADGWARDMGLSRVSQVVGLARREPERFPDRGSIRWAVERGKTGAAYVWRPDTLDRLIPEVEAWDRE